MAAPTDDELVAEFAELVHRMSQFEDLSEPEINTLERDVLVFAITNQNFIESIEDLPENIEDLC